MIDLAALDAALAAADDPQMVALMLANNETGVLQPVGEAAEIAHRYGASLHCDAVQAVGKVPVDFDALGVDTLALTGHKFGGPQGIGALVVRTPDSANCFMRGGGQERGLRGGTESVAHIVALGRAAEVAVERMDGYAALANLRDRMEARLIQATPGMQVFGGDAQRLPNTSADDAGGQLRNAGDVVRSCRDRGQCWLGLFGRPDRTTLRADGHGCQRRRCSVRPSRQPRMGYDRRRYRPICRRMGQNFRTRWQDAGCRVTRCRGSFSRRRAVSKRRSRRLPAQPCCRPRGITISTSKAPARA